MRSLTVPINTPLETAVTLARAWFAEYFAEEYRAIEADLIAGGADEDRVAEELLAWTDNQNKARARFLLQWLDDLMAARRGEFSETIQ
jgi:hypothetical protein